MRNFFLSLLLAPAALAQSDLSIRLVQPPQRALAGEQLAYVFDVENRGPNGADQVLIEMDIPGTEISLDEHPGGGFTCTAGRPVRCTSGRFGAGDRVSLIVRARLPEMGGDVRVAAAITSATPDPNPSNDFTSTTIRVVAMPDLFAEALFSGRLDPFSRAQFVMATINFAATPAENSRLTGTLVDGGTIVGYKAPDSTTCVISGPSITCNLGTLGLNQGARVDVDILTPERLEGGPYRLVVEVSSSNADYNPADNRREASATLFSWVIVSNTNDDGAGSLRQALLEAAHCNDICKVAFRIEGPAPESGWFTIRPRSPLPPVSGRVTIDGATQTAFTGDTNPEGPEIEINGALAGPADGLTLTGPCETAVRAVAVNGFDGHAIEARTQGQCSDQRVFHVVTIDSSYIGTDPRGRTAVPNRRGVVVASGRTFAAVTGNIISGNVRAGVYVFRAGHADILSNRIGVGRSGEALGNGASGVYVDEATADVDRNTIAHNGEWGVGRRAGTAEIGVTQNAIFANGLLGIDIGLDFETPPAADDSAFPNPPILFSASYDAATNTTTIRGRFDSRAPASFGSRAIEFFASRGRNRSGRVEGERYVGELRLAFNASPQDFTFVVKEDLTGQFITATSTRYRVTGFARPLTHRVAIPNTTSEFSNAVEVTR